MIKSTLLKIFIISVFICSIILASGLVYSKIENLNFLDAIYMTVITLTTTGFGDITPSTDLGKVFTIFLLLVGVGLVTYSITAILSHIVSIDFSERRRLKMEQKIKLLSGHTIVCGFGRMGEVVCKKLKQEGVTFVVIEKKSKDISELKALKYNYILGDAAHDEILEKAEISKAKVLISVIDNDSDGLYIALAGRSFNPDIQIIIRANEPNAEKRMIRAGANKVILPFVMSGLRVAETAINPAVEDFLNIKRSDDVNAKDELVQLADLYVSDESTLIGQSLREIGPTIKDIIVVGIRKPSNHQFIFNPNGAYRFEDGDCLIVMSNQETYIHTRDQFNLKTFLPNNVS